MSGRSREDLSAGLMALAAQIRAWLDWHRKHREENDPPLTTDDGTHIMALPVPFWPSHGAFESWIKLFQECSTALRAQFVSGGGMREILATAWINGHCRSRGITFEETNADIGKGSFLWNQALAECDRLLQGQELGTPAAKWREEGKPDPHKCRYDCERAKLAHGDMTDDEIANAVYLNNNDLGILTAAKDRIRWLSRALEATIPPSVPAGEAMREALKLSRETLLKHGYCGAGEDGTGDPEINLIDAALRTTPRCPHDMGFDNELGPFGCRLIGQELECVCEHMHFAALALPSTTPVPNAALAWLFGEGPDADGKWFGDTEPEIKPGKPIRRFWWRSKFRAMIQLPNSSSQERSEK